MRGYINHAILHSNREPPGDCRELFGHFVSHVRSHSEEVLLDVGSDYRRVLAAGVELTPLMPGAASGDESAGIASGSTRCEERLYFYPMGEGAERMLEAAWERITGGTATKGGVGGAVEVPVMFGRSLRVDRHSGGAVWCDFDDLCGRPRGEDGSKGGRHRPCGAFHVLPPGEVGSELGKGPIGAERVRVGHPRIRTS